MLNKVVIHPRHGRGVVKAIRNGGARLHVQYEGQPGLFISRIDEVEIEDINSSVSNRIRDYQREIELKPRRLIEAFRHGIVPKDCINEFTFGREQEIEQFRDWLLDPSASGLVLLGAYGSGKTHFLNYAEHIALEENFAVSLTEVNPLECPFSKPKRVYSQLIQNLKFKQSDVAIGDFEAMLKKILSQGIFSSHYYFRHVKEHINHSAAWQWIQAKEDNARPLTEDRRFDHFPGLYGHHGNTANIFCYLLSSLGWAAKQQQVGLNGLLLIFDEAEALGSNITPTYHYRSNTFLNALLATARNASRLKEKPSINAGFDYCLDADKIPFLYEIPSGLKIVLSLTDDLILRYSPETSNLPQMNLEPINETVASTVFEEIVKLYQEVYDISHESLKVDEIKDYLVNDVREMLTLDQGSTRLLVKSFVEALDLMRFHPNTDPFEVLQYG